MSELLEDFEIELTGRAGAAVGTCLAINDASHEVAENMCESCLEPSQGIFDAVHEMLVAIIYAILNEKEASVLVKVRTEDDGSPVITVHPDEEVKH